MMFLEDENEKLRAEVERKPTTQEERERWMEIVREVNEAAGVEWSWGISILRLIADVERLEMAMRQINDSLINGDPEGAWNISNTLVERMKMEALNGSEDPK